MGFYSADVGNPVRFGGLSINAGDGFSNGWNILYVPQRKLFDGRIGLAVGLRIGHLDGVAQIGPDWPVLTETAGWGFGDVTSRAQLGWQRGDFSHLVYVQAVAPTGRWQPGFTPIIGLHRPGIDTGWAFTWEQRQRRRGRRQRQLYDIDRQAALDVQSGLLSRIQCRKPLGG